MKIKYILPFLSCFLLKPPILAQTNDFTGNTLRIDYIFSGNSEQQEISVDELRTFKGWAGKHSNLDSIPLLGNGQIIMRDAQTKKILYKTSFSTLFQEWLGTEEARQVRRAFENVFLLPMPKKDVEIDVKLYGFKQNLIAKLTHKVSPNDILIRPLSKDVTTKVKILNKSHLGEKAIDIAIVSEGYTKAELSEFYKHAETAKESLFKHDPFKKYKECFNIRAVGIPSSESGVSVPSKREWKETALGSHFDTFYSNRYLTTLRLKKLHDALAGIPYEHIIILANTEEYGGGGIYNSYMLTTAKHPSFRPVIVHEFGHSFAGLADEYFYDDQFEEFYYPEIEPWEKNITTLKNFESKWKDLLSPQCTIPTPSKENDSPLIGVYEGGGYQSKGVYRGSQDCRMRTNEAQDFCPVCQRAIEQLIKFYTE